MDVTKEGNIVIESSFDGEVLGYAAALGYSRIYDFRNAEVDTSYPRTLTKEETEAAIRGLRRMVPSSTYRRTVENASRDAGANGVQAFVVHSPDAASYLEEIALKAIGIDKTVTIQPM